MQFAYRWYLLYTGVAPKEIIGKFYECKLYV